MPQGVDLIAPFFPPKIVVRKLRELVLQDKDLQYTTSTQLQDLNFCLRGLSPSEISNLPGLKASEFNNVVAAMGGTKINDKEFNMAQVSNSLKITNFRPLVHA